MVFNNSILLGAAGQGGAAAFDTTLIGNSVWLDGSADTLEKTFSSGSAQTKVVISTWVQRYSFGSDQTIFSATGGTGGSSRSNRLSFKSDDTFDIHIETSTLKTITYSTTAVFRDIGFYHILVSIDQGQTQGPEQVNLFVNGNEVTIAATDIDQGFSASLSSWGNACKHNIGCHNSASQFFKGSVTQTTMLVGQSIQSGDVAVSDFLDTFTFGTNGSQFIPKKDSDIAALASAAGGNSFCLDFGDSSDLGNDISSNNNDFTPNSMAAANQSENTPSNLYPIINIIDHSNDTLPTISEGNLRSAGPGASRACLRTTIPIPTTGKWYWEAKWNSVASARIGFAESTSQLLSNCGQSALSWGIQNDGTLVNNNSSGSALFSWSTNDIIAMAYDADNSKFWFGRIASGTTSVTWASSGNPETGANATVTSVPTQITPALDTNTGDVSLFFPEEDWTLSSKLSGFKEINSANLTTPDYQGIDYFDATLYEGNGFNQRVGNFVPFTDAYTVDKSVFFDDGDRRYLAKTFDSSDPTATSDPGGSNSAKATISFWIKYNRSVGSGDQHIFSTANTAQTQRFMIYRNEQSAEDFFFINMNPGPKMFKAPVQSAFLSEQEWSNVVINVDLDNSTGADKVKMFVNGVQITSVDTTYQSASNSNYFLFANEDHFIGNLAPADAGYTGFCLDSYLAEMHVIDGHVKAPTDFGQVDTSTNRWVAKDYKTNVNTYGNRGFYMAFDNASGTGDGVGTDSSGNGYTFTESFVSGGSAWASTDTVTDTPSKNFATLSSTRKSAGTLSEGNLSYDAGAASTVTLNCLATMPIPSSGKWAVKIINTTTGTNFASVGIGYMGTTDTPVSTNVNSTTGTHGVYYTGGTTKINGVSGPTLSTWKRPADGANPFVELFFDRDANTFKSKVNGGSLETITSALTEKQITFALIAFAGSTGSQYEVDFGQKGYTPSESGFLTLNQDNLDDTASKITALAWIKNRDASDDHILVDRVRGIGKVLHSNDLALETTEPNTVQRFLQRGVQVGNDVQVNTANESYVLWQWLVGDSATTGTSIGAGSISTGVPSIASTVLAADAGHFSVGTYTGQTSAGTVAHGLGGAPEMIIVWDKEFDNSIAVYHKFLASDAETDYLLLNSTGVPQDDATFWNDTAPNSSVFSVGTGNNTNGNGRDKLFLAFRSISGVCKLGSYTGNASSSGPYISTGFAPKWIFIRRYDSTTDAAWWTLDTVRDNTGNPTNHLLRLNTDGVEGANNASLDTDFLADGFKPRSTYTGINANNGTYIYMAMADIGGGGTLPPIYGR